MPTGVHLHNAQEQLFDAAERVLVRDGAEALTSRSVTDEAHCAKGVLHRHFTDFDAFLVGLILDRAAQLELQTSALLESAGDRTVADNLTSALSTLFGPVPMAIIPLVTFREELRLRLRQSLPGGGITILAQATAAISTYLSHERERGRLSTGVDIDSLTLSLVGGGHLLFAGRGDNPPTTTALNKFVAAVLADSVG